MTVRWGRSALIGAAAAIALLPVLAGCGDDGSTAGSPAEASAPAGEASGEPATETGGGAGKVTVTIAGKTQELVTDDCSTVEVPAKIFSLSTDDASLEMSLPHDPGPFSQDSPHAVVPLPTGASDDETFQTKDFTGERSESGATTTGSMKGTARRVTTGEEVEFSLDFSCPLVRS